MVNLENYLDHLNKKYGGISIESIIDTGEKVIVVDEIEVQKLINDKFPNRKCLLFPDDVAYCQHCGKWFTWDGGTIMLKELCNGMNGLYLCKKCSKISIYDVQFT